MEHVSAEALLGSEILFEGTGNAAFSHVSVQFPGIDLHINLNSRLPIKIFILFYLILVTGC